MRVLLQNRPSFKKSIAGDTIQLFKTKEYLDKIGAIVEISTDNQENLTQYDLVHLFNIMPVEDTYHFYCNAVRQRKKILLSPIFWDPDEFLACSTESIRFEEWWNRTMTLRKEVLAGVNLLLPNSKLEELLLRKFFQVLPESRIIPNAADRFFARNSPQRFIQRFKPFTEFVLSVGRICPRKNQLQLIKAVKHLHLPLILIGPLNDTGYYQECRKEASGGNVRFIDTLNQAELASAYAAARVHALVSWYDTPGLVSLEAALAGCRIVTTDRGCTSEYFENLVHYCDPTNLDSIISAVNKAWHSPVNPRLKEKVFAEYTWEETARQTLQAYHEVLD